MAADTAITRSDYFLLRAIHTAFDSPYHNQITGNLLWIGTDGKGARTIADAFAARKAQPGAFSTADKTKRVDQQKVAEYAKIAAAYYRDKTQTED